MKKLLLLTIFLGLMSCKKKSEIELNFLDEYIVEDSLKFKGNLIGGLSGVDYFNDEYYFVVDDARDPRYIKAKIDVQENAIAKIEFVDVVKIQDSTSTFFKNNSLDLESVFVGKNTGLINLVSEGSIIRGKNPSVFKVNSEGKFKDNYLFPNYFKASYPQKPKHNAVFESSSVSFDKKGFWVGMESVLPSDGEQPKFKKTQSPVRITYFSNKDKKATKQFVYQLDKIDKPAKDNININGVTAILEYDKNKFFVLERVYQNGYGAYGNVVKIYDVTLTDATTNTIDTLSLKETAFVAAKKTLLLNLDAVKDKLTNGIVDNIEGITFGPKLSNGNQSLILVSDDNFQKYGKQLNQFLLLEIKRN